MRRTAFLFAAAMAGLVASPLSLAVAQAPTVPTPALTPAIIRSTADTIAAQIERLCVEADTGRLIAERLMCTRDERGRPGLRLISPEGGSSFYAAASPPGQERPAAEMWRSELLSLEARWDSAVVAKDFRTLETILAPSFVYVSASGAVSTRAQMLEGLRAAALEIDPFETRDVEVRVYGNTAILTGWFEQTGRVDGKPYRVRNRYTDVYIRDGGRWVAVSAHASPAP